jgi:GNAT superfamily N-acetyltransferase
MSSPGLTALALRDVDDATLARFHAELMVPMFPPAELMTYAELQAEQQSEGADGTLLLDHGVPVGGIITEPYLDGRVLLVAYIVVADSLRSHGLGSELLATVAPSSPAAKGRLVLAEIDDPRQHFPGPFGDPARRVRFYQREGWQLLPLPYLQPSLRPATPRVEGLLLITNSAKVEGSLVADFLEEYFTGCEGAEGLATDLDYQSLHHAAKGPLDLHPLTELDAARRLL